MDIRLLLTFLALIASLMIVESLKKEILNLPPIIHFTDVFNTQHSENEYDKTNIFSSGSSYPQQTNWPGSHVGYQQGSWHSGWPNSGQSGYNSHHHSGYPWQSGYPPYGYPHSGYPHHGFPPICHQYEGGRPHRPRQEDVEVVERYFKFNDDGSKEYKLVLNNGLNIYQKMMSSKGDKQNIQMLEGYYSDKRDDNSYITTYFRADDTGYSASSEISDSPPTFPDVKEMIRIPDDTSNKKNKK